VEATQEQGDEMVWCCIYFLCYFCLWVLGMGLYRFWVYGLSGFLGMMAALAEVALGDVAKAYVLYNILVAFGTAS
jgi:hypothetical protein